jgi:hypothetical protein
MTLDLYCRVPTYSPETDSSFDRLDLIERDWQPDPETLIKVRRTVSPRGWYTFTHPTYGPCSAYRHWEEVAP